MNKQITYAKRKYEKDFVKLKKKSNALSYCRLAVFILILILFCVLFENKIGFVIAIIYILTAVFIGLVLYHYFVDTKMSDTESYLGIIDEYMMRETGEWNDIDSNFDTELDYINDLNLIGKSSLFSYINMTKTLGGKKRLFSKFKLPKTSKEIIEEKQEAIEELTDDFDFILNTESILNDIKDVNDTDFKDYLYLLDSNLNYSIIPFIISIVLSIVSLSMLVIGIINPVFLSCFVLMIIIQVSYSFFYSNHRTDYYQKVNICTREFSKLKNIYDYLSHEKMEAKLNKQIINKIKKGNKTLKKIYDLSWVDSLRNNIVTYVIFNTLFSLNFVIIFLYKKLLDTSTDEFKESIEALEELETMISFATIGYTKKNIVLPKIENKISICFKELYHPLLEEKKCVPNTFETLEDINIITGSNMSGKTSFMKTIGVNLVLAYNGSYVNAHEFSCSIMNIFTSINVKDDISKGISTFYGELLRIKRILDYSSKNDEPLVVFIDEIFKGTNYNDRIIGAKETLKKLSKLKCIVFLTTHDFELCDIKHKKINNYHFSEDYVKNKISFDYKIKEGKCKTTNAKYLMKQMNIIDE